MMKFAYVLYDIFTSPWTWGIISIIGIGVGLFFSYKFTYRFGYKSGSKESDTKWVNKIEPILSKGTGKYGIITKYNGYNSNTIDHVIEIEEMESAGDMTKVRVI